MGDVNIDKLVDYRDLYSKNTTCFVEKFGKGMAICPFHEEKNASMSIDLETGKFNCFGCGESGNAVNFIAKIKGIDTKQAFKLICETYNIKNEFIAEKKDSEYSVEDYSKEKLLPLEFLESIGVKQSNKYSIEIPYFDYTDKDKKVVATRIRKHPNSKQRFYWKKDSNIQLYKCTDLEFKEELILVEGESDTQTLTYCCVPAIGVPGASMFKSIFSNEILKQSAIYINNEGGDAGTQFVTSILRKMRADSFSGKIYMMNCGEFKDPSEAFIKFGGDKEKLKKYIIDRALQAEDITNENEEDIFSIEPTEITKNSAKIIVPPNYIINKTGILKNVYKKNEIVIDTITHTAMYIKKIYTDIDSNEQNIEIEYLVDTKKYEYKTVIVPKSIIASSTNILKLSNYGINVTTTNAKKLVDYFSDFENSNSKYIENIYSTKKMGWHNKDFVPYSDKIKVISGGELQNISESYTTKGNRDLWYETMNAFRNTNKVFRFMMATAFTAPILNIFQVRSFLVHFWEDSRSGKTASMKCVLSSFGNSEYLMRSFNSTANALEAIASLHNDLLFAIDERQMAKSDEFLNGLIYILGNGKGKDRMKADGTMHEKREFRTLAISTGEEKMTNDRSFAGVISRILEIKGKPFDKEEDASRMYSFTRENYGFAGKEMIEYLQTNYNEFTDKYIDIYKDKRAKYIKQNPNSISSHIEYIALIETVDEFISEVFFKTEKTTFDEFIVSSSAKKDEDGNEKPFERFSQFYVSNISKYAVIENKKTTYYPANGCIGKIQQEDNNVIVYTFVSSIKDYLEKSNVSYNKALQYMQKNNLIKSDGEGKSSVLAKVNGVNVRCIALILNDTTIEDVVTFLNKPDSSEVEF